MAMRALYIVWNEEQNLGVPILDEQHRGIVATINSFHYFLVEGHGDKALDPTLRMLEQYTRLHFQTEENLMREAKYPGLAAHMAQHQALIRRMAAVAANKAKAPQEVLEFLKDWWIGHIAREDRKYDGHLGRFLKGLSG